jgi:hypothetical protein
VSSQQFSRESQLARGLAGLGGLISDLRTLGAGGPVVTLGVLVLMQLVVVLLGHDGYGTRYSRIEYYSYCAV